MKQQVKQLANRIRECLDELCAAANEEQIKLDQMVPDIYAGTDGHQTQEEIDRVESVVQEMRDMCECLIK